MVAGLSGVGLLLAKTQASNVGAVVSQILSRFMFWALLWGVLLGIMYVTARYEYEKVEPYLKNMEPELEGGNQIFCDTFADYQPGDILWLAGEKNPFPARLLAVAGDDVSIEQGRIFINGEKIHELYSPTIDGNDSLATLRVPDLHVFVLGDSRRWKQGPLYDCRLLGPVPVARIIGTVR